MTFRAYSLFAAWVESFVPERSEGVNERNVLQIQYKTIVYGKLLHELQ